MDSNKKNDILVLGGTLFSMFFGAGNLIFPPALGLSVGSKWLPALIGFFLTGIGLPLLSVVASAKCKGDVNKLGEKISPGFSKFLGLIVVLCIGPFLGIPRTGATTYEMAVTPFFPNFNPLLFSFIYFGIALALVINPTNIVDKIGKVLTPALLIILALIIIFGIIAPGEPIDKNVATPFTEGFEGGYQTMDAFAALLFGGMIVVALMAKGYETQEEHVSMTLKSGLIAIIGLTFVYGGLGYLGAKASAEITGEISKVDLIRHIAESSLKSYGSIGLSLAVSLACLTTSIGLISTTGQFFHNFSNGKVSYRNVVIITSIFSAIVSVAGVEKMVSFSAPILGFFYPMVIVMIVLTVILKDGQNSNIFKGAVALTILMSIMEVLGHFSFGGVFVKILNFMPLASLGLPWLVPAVAGGIIGKMIPEKKQANMTVEAE